MTGRKKRALQVSPVVPYTALGNFPNALNGTTGVSRLNKGKFNVKMKRKLINME